MGVCCSSNAQEPSSTSSKAPAPTAAKSLLDPASGKTAPGNFNIYLDSHLINDSLLPSEDDMFLKVESVQGGAFGIWNNRANNDNKVAKGDLIVKVRDAKAEDGQWIVGQTAGDAKKMLDALAAGAVFEAEIKPVISKATEQQEKVAAPETTAEPEKKPEDTLEVPAPENTTAAQDTQHEAAGNINKEKGGEENTEAGKEGNDKAADEGKAADKENNVELEGPDSQKN